MSETTTDRNEPADGDETSEMRFGAGETAWLAVVTVLALLGVALGILALVTSGGDGGSAAPADTGGGELSALATQGQELADANGCATCHSVDGSDGTGPTWQGLAGAEVTLDDGTTVTADDAYLTSSITDPGAQKVEGFAVAMPEFELSTEEVDALVAYINSLGGAG